MSSAFDRIGQQGDILSSIEENTRATAESVAVGGDLYSRIDALTTALEDIQSGKTSGGTDLKQALALAIVAPSMKPIGLGLGYVVDALNKLEGGGKEIAEKMEAITKGLVVLGDVGKSILLFAGYMVLAAPLLLITAALSPIIGLSLFAITTAVMLATKNLDDKKLESIAKLKEVGLGILAFTASLALTSLIIIPALKGALGAMVIVGLTTLVVSMLPDKGIEKMEQLGNGMLKLALGIGAVVAVFALTSLIIAPALKGAIAAIGIVAAIGGVFYLLDTLGVVDKIEDGSKGLLFAAGAILGLGIALALFDVISPPLETLMSIALVVGTVGLTFGLIGILGDNIRKGAIALMFAGLAIVVLAASLKILSLIVGTITGEEAVKSLGALLLIGLIGSAFYLAGTQAPIIVAGAGAMALVGISVIVLALGVKILSNALGDDGWNVVGQTMALVGGLGVAMGVAGLAAPFIAAGAGALILAGGALIAIGAGMTILKKLDFKSMTANGGILGDSGQKTKGFLGIGGGRPKTNMEVMMEALANSFMISPLGMAAMYAGAPALILAGGALISIATGIKEFQKIAQSADLKSLGENVNTIVYALSDTFGKIGTMYPGGRQGLFSSIFGGGGGSVVAQGISSVMGMGKALTNIAMGVQSMAELKFPTGYDKEGNATGYETINLSDAVPKLIVNTQEIVRGLTSVFAEVGESNAAQGSTWFTSSSYEKGIKVVKKMGEPLFNLANGVQKMAELKFPTGYDSQGNPTGYKSIGNVKALIGKITTNTKALIIGLAGVFEEVGNSESADTSWFSKNNFEKGADLVMALADPYSSLAATLDNVTTITSKVSDATEVKEKVTAIISSITDAGGSDAGLMSSKAYLIKVIGGTYEKLGVAIPAIVSAISTFTVEKAKAFAAIFGGESPAELFESKANYLNGLSASYVKMAMAIPLIVGSINTASAEQLNAFTSVYGGTIPVEESAIKARENLFIAVGNAYEKMGQGTQQITSSISGADPEKLNTFKGMFLGDVGMLRPIAGYEAQTELWNAIGRNTVAAGGSYTTIASAINSMDIAKLVEARQMFEALAVLSEGGENPEDILESMGESLEGALENLADMLESFKSTVEAQGEAQGSMLTDIASMPSQLVGGLIDGISGRGSGDVDMSGVVQAIGQLQAQLISRGIKINGDLL